MKLYEFAVIWNPTSDQAKEGKKSELIVAPTTILAKDDSAAFLQAARAIPAEKADELDQMDIAVRPF